MPSNIGIVNDLTTGGADVALSASAGKEIAESAYRSNYEPVPTTIGANNPDLDISFVVGQRGPGLSGGIAVVNTAPSNKRATMNKYFTRSSFIAQTFIINLPEGYQFAVRETNSTGQAASGTFYDSGFKDVGTEYTLNPNYTYFAITFKKLVNSAEVAFTSTELAEMAEEFALTYQGPAEPDINIVDMEGNIIRSIYNADNLSEEHISLLQVRPEIFTGETTGEDAEITSNRKAKMTVGTNGVVYTGTYAPNTFIFPNATTNNLSSDNDFFNVSDYMLDGRVRIKASQPAEGRYVVAVCFYDSSRTFISRVGYYSLDDNTGWSADFSVPTNAAKFVVLLTAKDGNDADIATDNVVFSGRHIYISNIEVVSRGIYGDIEDLDERVSQLEGTDPANAQVSLRVMSYNIGHFSVGTQQTTTISDQETDGWPDSTDRNYDIQLNRWKNKVSGLKPDIMCMPEYSSTFGSKNGSNVSTESSGIFSGYNLSVGKSAYGGYWINAIASKYALSNAVDVDLDSLSGAGVAYVRVAEATIGGHTVKIGVTHLNWNQSQTHYDSRQEEIKSLIKLFQDDDYVILCGDFNTEGPYGASDAEIKSLKGTLEFEPFLYGFTEDGVDYDGGYTLANHGLFGNHKTFPSTYSRPDRTGQAMIPTSFIDNVIVKGFTMSNVRVVDDGTLTDHCGIYCELTMIL